MGKALMKTSLLALGNDLWYLYVFLPQEIQELSYNFWLVLIQWDISIYS